MRADRDVVTARFLNIRVCWPPDATIVDVVVLVASSAVTGVVVHVVAIFDVTVVAFDVVPGPLFVRGKGDLLRERMVSIHA